MIPLSRNRQKAIPLIDTVPVPFFELIASAKVPISFGQWIAEVRLCGSGDGHPSTRLFLSMLMARWTLYPLLSVSLR